MLIEGVGLHNDSYQHQRAASREDIRRQCAVPYAQGASFAQNVGEIERCNCQYRVRGGDRALHILCMSSLRLASPYLAPYSQIKRLVPSKSQLQRQQSGAVSLYRRHLPINLCQLREAYLPHSQYANP